MLSDYFPNAAGKRLLISEEAKNYISRPRDAAHITKIIKEEMGNRIIITDATANVGGDTISFAKTFTSVNSVEIDPEFFDMLKHNIEQYDLGNVRLYNDDYLNIMKKLKQDIVYMDPPWGGRDYIHAFTVDLYLGDKDILDIITQILSEGIAQRVYVKVPYNYNFKKLLDNIKYTRIRTYMVRNYIIISIAKD